MGEKSMIDGGETGNGDIFGGKNLFGENTFTVAVETAKILQSWRKKSKNVQHKEMNVRMFVLVWSGVGPDFQEHVC